VRCATALLAVALWACGAGAAELPSRGVKTKAAPDKGRTCLIEGERGVETPGGMCIRVSGYVSVGIGGGDVKR
jgi:hypothetical protein